MKTSDETVISPSTPIDLNLVDQVVERIPEHTWEVVRKSIVETLVDMMPSDILERLTGKLDDFDRAEEILFDYYELPERKRDLICDAFKIMGEEDTLYRLDSLELDRIEEQRNCNEDD